MIVLDANVAVKTYMVEAGSDAATELLAGPSKFLAPELIRLEVCGALCRRVRQGELAADEAKKRSNHWIKQLEGGLVALIPDGELLLDALDFSVKLKHALDDCLYLAVAIRHEAQLITADRPFFERAKPVYKKITMLAGCENN
jgi:predicted nucleic acid-binding protein